MDALREIKARARADLHEAMRVGALYYGANSEDPVPCFVRVHSKFAALGDVKGTSFSYAETREEVPQLIFWHSEVDPEPQGVVSIGPDEAYRVGTSDPPYGDTTTAYVTRLTLAEITRLGLSYPGEV